jgi:trehalose 6-phosphate synthase/phosphatase
MLNADQIGFTLFEYARHFVHCCRRILGVDFEYKRGGRIAVHTQEARSVVITMSVPGVEPALVRARVDVPSVADAVRGNMLKYAGKFVVAGIDWCDRLSGLPLKLLAFKRLLTDRPELASRVVFVQIAHNAATTNVAGQETEGNTHELIVGAGKSIGELVAAINDEFGCGEQIVEYLEVRFVLFIILLFRIVCVDSSRLLSRVSICSCSRSRARDSCLPKRAVLHPPPILIAC